MMNDSNILLLTEKHVVNLRRLAEVVIEKQNALINNDYEKLSLAISEEEKILNTVSAISRERERSLKTLKSKYEHTEEKFTLTDYLRCAGEGIPSENRTRLNSYIDEIKNLAEEITLENYLNLTLIENSRHLLNDMVSVLAGNERNSILDRKY